MYFDVDHQIEIPESQLESAFASAAQEITRRRGRVIAMSRDILVFSATFLRIYGLPRLPLGVSHGVFQVMTRDGVCVIRSRISLLSLRVCITAIVALLLVSTLTPGAGAKAILWTVLLASIVVGGMIYAVAIAQTRKFFKKLLLRPDKSVGG